MTPRAHIAFFGLTLAFVASGVAFAFGPHPQPLDPALVSASEKLLTGMGDLMLQFAPPVDLPLMHLRPNAAYLVLLLAVWGFILLESLGQIIDPSPGVSAHLIAYQVGTLASGAIWPWLIHPAPALAAIGATAAAGFAIMAVFQTRGQLRPGVGFLAGWATMLAAAMVAAWLGIVMGFDLPTTIVLAVAGGTAVGATVSIKLGRTVAYPLAVIGWLSALIVTMLGASTSVTLTAIVAIIVMTLALVRSVT